MSAILSDVPIIVVIITSVSSIIVFFLTLLTRNSIERKILSSKLLTEHEFDQKKKIKESLAKYKVKLVDSAEDLNHRMRNYNNSNSFEKINVSGNYIIENYYFHSFIYRILSFFAWIKIIEEDMIFLDTTIASRDDLDFIKFLKLFPQVFCDLNLLDDKGDEKRNESDSFTRNEFEVFSEHLINDKGAVISYLDFIKELQKYEAGLGKFYPFLDGTNPHESRKRFYRLQFLQLSLALFLNNYGYDYQRSTEKQILRAVTKPVVNPFIKNYFKFIDKFCLGENKQVQMLRQAISEYKHNSQHQSNSQVTVSIGN